MADGPQKKVEQLLRGGLDQLDIRVTEQSLTELVRYCLELEKWNRKFNLVAKDTTLADIAEKHFLDSLTLVPVLDRLGPHNLNLLDVGSGAGFPGLVVKIARPEWNVTLLEPRERRVVFLRHIIRLSGLTAVNVDASRIEKEQLPVKRYGIITGRAVASVPLFLEMVASAASIETRVVCMQGAAGKQDLRKGSMVNGFECREVVETSLPFSGDKRFILLFGKAVC